MTTAEIQARIRSDIQAFIDIVKERYKMSGLIEALNRLKESKVQLKYTHFYVLVSRYSDIYDNGKDLLFLYNELTKNVPVTKIYAIGKPGKQLFTAIKELEAPNVEIITHNESISIEANLNQISNATYVYIYREHLSGIITLELGYALGANKTIYEFDTENQNEALDDL